MSVVAAGQSFVPQVDFVSALSAADTYELDAYTNQWVDNTGMSPGFYPHISTRQNVTNTAGATGVTGVSASNFAVWMMCQQHTWLFNRWKRTGRQSLRTKIANNWAAFQASWAGGNSLSQLAGGAGAFGGSNGIAYALDDATWYADFLRQVHEATGDETALQCLLSWIPATLTYFADPNNSRTTVGSVMGNTFAYSPYGSNYQSGVGQNFAGEVLLGLTSLYCYKVTGRTDYLAYADAVYNIYNTYNKYSSSSTAAITYCSATLRSGAAPTPDQSGTTNKYPEQGDSAFYIAGTMFLATYAARRYRMTGTASWLSDVKTYVNGIITPQTSYGFLQTTGTIGYSTLLNDRDPWTDAQPLYEFAEEVLTLPGADPYGSLRGYVTNTATSVASQRYQDNRNGAWVYPADWGGPLAANDDYGWKTYLQQANQLQGTGTPPQGDPIQQPTFAMAGCVLEAGALIASWANRQ